MTPELLEAMETVRRYDAGDGAVGSHDHERVSAAFRLLARYLVEHAGELVRVKTCYECLGNGCLLCDGSGRIYEPLTAKGDA